MANYVTLPTGEKIKIVDNGDGTFSQEVSLEAGSLATENGALNVGNAKQKFRDGFASLASGAAPDPLIWDTAWTNQGTGTAARAGDAAGSSYLKISLDPLTADSQFAMTSKDYYKLPCRFINGVSMSHRQLGLELEVSLVGCSDVGTVETFSDVADRAISGTITVTSNVATINFASQHGLKGGDRVILVGNTDSRLNVGPVLVTVVTATQITVPLTLTNGTYTAGGVIRWADVSANSMNTCGLLYENTTTTQATYFTRRNGSSPRISQGQGVATTTATQSNTSPYSDAFNSANMNEIDANMQEFLYVSRSADTNATPSGTVRWSQGIPDEEKYYKLRVRAKQLANITRPVAKIVSISKSGTTTATVTTDVPHGLTTSDFVNIYGVRDQTNFANLTAQTQVASVINSTQFTIVLGAAVTASSAGGSVIKVQGSVALAGIYSQVIQSLSRTNNVLTLVGSATWATPLPGETVQIHGCDATSMGLYDGAYKVLRVNTTSLELESVGADFTTINAGGSVIRRADVRIHFIGQLEHTRHIVEMHNQHGATDNPRALPVVFGTASSLNAITTVTTVAAVTSSNLGIPTLVADVASAAITTTTTTTAVTPTFGTTYIIDIPVTAVTGTNPTMDVVVQESDDTGTNWYDVYHFERITATGIYRSPALTLRGNRIRYVQTIGGTTPSFTRAINRLQRSDDAPLRVRYFDRTINPNTLSSTSPIFIIDGLQTLNVNIRCTAQTTAATIALRVSNDGTNWLNLSSTMTTVVGIAQVKFSGELWKFGQLIVTSAGTGITLGEAVISGSS